MTGLDHEIADTDKNCVYIEAPKADSSTGVALWECHWGNGDVLRGSFTYYMPVSPIRTPNEFDL